MDDSFRAQQFLSALSAHKTVRPETWQGPLARGGPRQTPKLSSAKPVQKTVPSSVPETSSLSTRSAPFWHLIAEAVGDEQRGRLVATKMQQKLMQRVKSVPLDELKDLMAISE